ARRNVVRVGGSESGLLHDRHYLRRAVSRLGLLVLVNLRALGEIDAEPQIERNGLGINTQAVRRHLAMAADGAAQPNHELLARRVVPLAGRVSENQFAFAFDAEPRPRIAQVAGVAVSLLRLVFAED